MDPSSTLFYHKLPKNQFAAQEKFTLAGSNNQEVFYTQVQVLAILKQSRIWHITRKLQTNGGDRKKIQIIQEQITST